VFRGSTRDRVVNGLLNDPQLSRTTIYFHALSSFENLSPAWHAAANLRSDGRVVRFENEWPAHHTGKCPSLRVRIVTAMGARIRSFIFLRIHLGNSPGGSRFRSCAHRAAIGPVDLGPRNHGSSEGPNPKPTFSPSAMDILSAEIELPPGVTGTLAYQGRTSRFAAGACREFDSIYIWSRQPPSSTTACPDLFRFQKRATRANHRRLATIGARNCAI